MPNSSASVANVPGTGVPSSAWCNMVREVLNPSAPAAMASFTIAAMRSMSSAVAFSFCAPRSPITYARTGACAICVPTSMTYGVESMKSRYSGKVSQPHRMPAASAVPGMSSTPSMSSLSHWRLSGATGAKPTPQFPMTTVVTPWKHEGVRYGSQVT
ncbi:unannotated protein [freshwater metagenome]|uniref:Unannotated protein n=1 Tax=freshwater metagenome TaxID=449393 RepID=A0A6J7GSF7_9ZZZZ